MKRIASVLLTLVMAVGIVFVTATPASATSYWGCSTGISCVWVDSSGLGSVKLISVGNSGYNTCHNLTGTWNDVVSSASADFGGGWDLKLFKHADCANGNVLTNNTVVSSGSKSYTGVNYWFNDVASSYKIVNE